jgi:hypothetical protein
MVFMKFLYWGGLPKFVETFGFWLKSDIGDQMKEDEVGGQCRTHGGDEKCAHLGLEPEVKRPLGRPRSRWEDNINVCEISGSHGDKYEDDCLLG